MDEAGWFIFLMLYTWWAGQLLQESMPVYGGDGDFNGGPMHAG